MDSDKKQPQSLFDIVAKKYARPKEKKEPSPLVQKMPEVLKEEDVEQEQDELKTFWKRCKKMHQEIETRLEELFSQSSVTPQALSRFLSNPRNFTQHEWQKLDEEREKNRDKIRDLCGSLPSGGEKSLEKYVQGVSFFLKKKESDQVTQPSIKPVSQEGLVEKKPSESEPQKKKRPPPRHKWLGMR